MAFTCFNLILLRNILIELYLNEFYFHTQNVKKEHQTKGKNNRKGNSTPQPANYESTSIPLNYDGKFTGKIRELKTTIKNSIISLKGLFVLRILFAILRSKYSCTGYQSLFPSLQVFHLLQEIYDSHSVLHPPVARSPKVHLSI